jgi:SET domain-containing protein
MKSSSGSPPYRVRRSKIHGTGVFATRHIPKGTRIIEYLGERVSHAEADRRYAGKADDDNHTFLFTVDARTVIDAGVGGNAARYLNHSCAPNCETLVEDRRIFIEAIEDIEAGAELAYDYMIERDASDPPDIDVVFGCRCGARGCRGTMLLPPKRPPARRTARPRDRRPARTRA